MILLLDAANTIIHKPSLFTKVFDVLTMEGYSVNQTDLKLRHKLLSEIIVFPDKTDKEFYTHFNAEWLYSLGITPNKDLLDQLFSACSYLSWEAFDDTSVLNDIEVPKAILSNFHSGLNNLLDNLFPGQFVDLTISEKERCRKPDLAFFERAVEKLGVPASEIIYIGDSLKLDLEPALKIGMNAWLIDRENYFYACNRRISNLSEIKKIIA